MSTLQNRIILAFRNENARRTALGFPKLTKTELWKSAGLSSSAASHWFSGSNEMDLDTAEKVAPLLRVSAKWLFDESEPMLSKASAAPALPSSVSVITPPTERDTWTAELTGLAAQLDTLRLGMLIKTARDLLAEQPAKQTPQSTG